MNNIAFPIFNLLAAYSSDRDLDALSRTNTSNYCSLTESMKSRIKMSRFKEFSEITGDTYQSMFGERQKDPICSKHSLHFSEIKNKYAVLISTQIEGEDVIVKLTDFRPYNFPNVPEKTEITSLNYLQNRNALSSNPNTVIKLATEPEFSFERFIGHHGAHVIRLAQNASFYITYAVNEHYPSTKTVTIFAKMHISDFAKMFFSRDKPQCYESNCSAFAHVEYNRCDAHIDKEPYKPDQAFNCIYCMYEDHTGLEVAA